MRLSPPSPAMKAIPTVWDEVCKAFAQLGADPDLALGAVSQEKSPLENSQWLLCVRSSPPPPGSAQERRTFPVLPLGRSRAWAPCASGDLCAALPSGSLVLLGFAFGGTEFIVMGTVPSWKIQIWGHPKC